jgi:hypothetical protein
LLKVVRRSVIREDLHVSSADVGFLQADESVYILQLKVMENGTTRGKIDRGWVTIMGVSIGFGRILTLYHRASTSYQIR